MRSTRALTEQHSTAQHSTAQHSKVNIKWHFFSSRISRFQLQFQLHVVEWTQLIILQLLLIWTKEYGSVGGNDAINTMTWDPTDKPLGRIRAWICRNVKFFVVTVFIQWATWVCIDRKRTKLHYSHCQQKAKCLLLEGEKYFIIEAAINQSIALNSTAQHNTARSLWNFLRFSSRISGFQLQFWTTFAKKVESKSQ